ncbi:MAG: cation:proton antiporter [Desulfonatronovibrio sp.]
MQTSIFLIVLGGLLLSGLAVEAMGKHTPLPRVTLLLIFGFAIGPSGWDFLPDIHGQWFPVVADMALLMIGFLLGEQMVRLLSGNLGRVIITVSLSVALGTALVVLAGLWLMGVPLITALLLAGIAAATAPAATMDVVEESDSQGPFTSVLVGVVAIDDAWSMLVFSILLAAALVLAGGGSGMEGVWLGLHEVGGALLLGLCLGLVMAYLTGRIRPGQPTLAEALGFVFLCGGLAEWLEFSFLLAAMVMGAVVYRLASHHQRPFHEIEHIDWPFKMLFFILAGASLHVDALLQAGFVVAGYIVLRVIGKMTGAMAGGWLCSADPTVRRWLGPTLLPQAGIALGMALIAADRFPDQADTLMAIAIGATVFFEVIGPVITRYVLVHVGETDSSSPEKDSSSN